MFAIGCAIALGKGTRYAPYSTMSELFNLSINDVMSIALFRAVQNLARRRKEHFLS